MTDELVKYIKTLNLTIEEIKKEKNPEHKEPVILLPLLNYILKETFKNNKINDILKDNNIKKLAFFKFNDFIKNWSC